MLVPRRLRLLTTDPLDHPRGQPHLSSASGIVQAGHFLYVVADDEHHLARLDARDPAASALQWIRFLPGALPQGAAERKKRKPDVEVLMHLPAVLTGGRELLALFGSGSRLQRERVFTLALQPDGDAPEPAVEVDAAELHAPLRDHFAETNLEAGYAGDGVVHLFHRANRGQPLNARVTYEASPFCAWLTSAARVPPRPVGLKWFSLGEHEGVPFGITDAAAWGPAGCCVFTAVAESTSDAYQDGACVASMVGWMDADGQVHRSEQLMGAPKVEGILPVAGRHCWLVTDADDPDRAAQLLEIDWP